MEHTYICCCDCESRDKEENIGYQDYADCEEFNNICCFHRTATKYNHIWTTCGCCFLIFLLTISSNIGLIAIILTFVFTKFPSNELLIILIVLGVTSGLLIIFFIILCLNRYEFYCKCKCMCYECLNYWCCCNITRKKKNTIVPISAKKTSITNM